VRKLNLPEVASIKTEGQATQSVTLENTVPSACPRFTIHIIRNVTIGPSPKWLVEALESVGQRSINNVVDVTNFINFEFGNPCHAFDLAKLAGRKVIIRYAREGEPLTTLDGKQRKLKADEVVVADAERAQSLAGVIGGSDSEVSSSTKDVVLEMATWDPVAVRRAARRHQVKTDASHRFERIVDPRTLDFAARRAAVLIAELGKGTLCGGMIDSAAASAPLREIAVRPARARSLLGINIADTDISAILQRLDIKVMPAASALNCAIPPFRPDLEREVDLIEEIGRINGLDAIPIHDRATVRVRPPQDSERAIRELATTLTGLGFYETVTFSFIAPKQAQPFLAPGLSPLAVSDDRRKGDGTLRPSTLPSLLACRKKNQDGGVETPGGIRLFETAATFSQPEVQKPSGRSPAHELRTLALLMDVPGVGKGKPGSVEERQHGLRILRGAIESAALALGGAAAEIQIRTAAAPLPACDPSATADVRLNGQPIGWLGLIDAAAQRSFDLAIPVAAAELDLGPLLALFPAKSSVHTLPEFPGIERDLSLVLAESVTWDTVRSFVQSAKLEGLEDITFVGAFRGKQLGPGKKSLTLRLKFRDPKRTLRHEEVDPQVASLVQLAGSRLGAALRA
jgi:phenylalanyl-tRNA synthetase beta chain